MDIIKECLVAIAEQYAKDRMNYKSYVKLGLVKFPNIKSSEINEIGHELERLGCLFNWRPINNSIEGDYDVERVLDLLEK